MKIERSALHFQAPDAIAYKEKRTRGKEMNIATAKEVLGKASGWGSFSYVETITKTETNGEKTVTRYELNCHPKKAKREWFGAIGEWIAKMAPWGVILYIASEVVKLFVKHS